MIIIVGHLQREVSILLDKLSQVHLTTFAPKTVVQGWICHLGRRHKRRSRKCGARKTIAVIATRVDIRKPHVGNSIQSYTQRRIKSLWMHM